MSDVTLAACPFCGTDAEGLAQPADGNKRWAVMCVQCGAFGPLHANPGEACDLWNRRATDGVKPCPDCNQPMADHINGCPLYPPIGTPRVTCPQTAAGVKTVRGPLRSIELAAIGREHFGNPIPREFYDAARSVERAHGIDVPVRVAADPQRNEGEK